MKHSFPVRRNFGLFERDGHVERGSIRPLAPAVRGAGAAEVVTTEDVFTISKGKLYLSGVLLASAGAALGYGYGKGHLTGNNTQNQAAAVAAPAVLAAAGWYTMIGAYNEPKLLANA